MTKNYFNIPVDDEDTYISVREIAKSNGFGPRGMGQQIKAWVAQTLAFPVCDHPKSLVQVQRSPGDTVLTEIVESKEPLFYQAYYCPTCQRVYRLPSKPKIVATETLTEEAQDPYGQPAQVVGKKRRVQRPSMALRAGSGRDS